MSGKNIVLIWDNDTDGSRHKGNLIHSALRRAKKEELIELKCIQNWEDFEKYLNEELRNIIERLERQDKVIFFIHTGEANSKRAFTQIASGRAVGPWSRLVINKPPFLYVLLYSGGSEPNDFKEIISKGNWVVEVESWQVSDYVITFTTSWTNLTLRTSWKNAL